MKAAGFLYRTATAAALAPALALTCSIAGAAPQDPARVDGTHGYDPAAVSAAPPADDGGLLSADAWQRFRANADGGAGARPRSKFVDPPSARDSRSGWLDQLLSPDDTAADTDLRLQRGVRAAQEAMDGMGRQLMPALRDLQRDFDEGLQQAQSRQR